MPLRTALQVISLRDSLHAASRRKTEEAWQNEVRSFERDKMEFSRMKMGGEINDMQFREAMRPRMQRLEESKLRNDEVKSVVDYEKLLNEYENLPLENEARRAELGQSLAQSRRNEIKAGYGTANDMLEHLDRHGANMPPEERMAIQVAASKLQSNYTARANDMLGLAPLTDEPSVSEMFANGARHLQKWWGLEGLPQGDLNTFFEVIAGASYRSADPEGHRAIMLSLPDPESLAQNWFYDGVVPPEDEDPFPSEPFTLEDSHRELIGAVTQRATQHFRSYDDTDMSVELRRTMAYNMALTEWGGDGLNYSERYTIGREVAERFSDFVGEDVQRAYASVVTRDEQRLAETLIENLEPLARELGDFDHRSMLEDISDNIEDTDRLAGIIGHSGPIDAFGMGDIFSETSRSRLDKLISDGKGRSKEAVSLYMNGIFNTIGSRIVGRKADGWQDAFKGLQMVEENYRSGGELGGFAGTIISALKNSYLQQVDALQAEKTQLSPVQAEYQMGLARERNMLGIWAAGNDSKPYTAVPLGTNLEGRARSIQIAAAFESGEAMSIFLPESAKQMMKDRGIDATAFDAQLFFEAQSMFLSPTNNDALGRIREYVEEESKAHASRSVHRERLSQISSTLGYIEDMGGRRYYNEDDMAWHPGRKGLQIGMEAEAFSKATGLPPERAADVVPLIASLHEIGFDHDAVMLERPANWREQRDFHRKRYMLANIELYKALNLDLRDIVGGAARDEVVFKPTGLSGIAQMISAEEEASAQGAQQPDRPERVTRGVPTRRGFWSRDFNY